MTDNKPQPPFRYDLAQKWLAGWVSTVNHPELGWAWNTLVGVIDVYAMYSLTPKEGMQEKRAEFWNDWFASWGEEGEAHHGIYGMMQEFANACPEGLESEQLLVIAEAFAYGQGVKTLPKGKRKAGLPDKKPTLPPVTLRVLKGGKN